MLESQKSLDDCYSQGKKIAPGCYLLLIFLFINLFNHRSVLAQSSNNILVQPPGTNHFPEITLSFKLPYTHRETVSDLRLNQITVFENDAPIQPDSLNKDRSGVHFTLALNPGMPLDIHDIEGISSYDKLREALVSWAEKRSILIGDSMSFVGDSGILIANSKDKDLWIDMVNGYQPNFRILEPNPYSLELAVEKSQDRIVPFGVDKSILYITPAPLPGQIEAINQLSIRASSAGIQINVWMVDEAYFLTNDQGGALIDLAKNTGGNFFHYTGSEVIPDPEDYFVDLGYYYTLSYQSNIRETGTNSLRIELSAANGEIRGTSPSFFIEVEPPKPILVSPPAVITRTSTLGDTGNLDPTTQSIEFMIEFPDGRPRPISTSRLFVDGKMVSEQQGEKSNCLTWDLLSLSNSGDHMIQVEVEDALGLSARTILTPIQVDIVEPEPEKGFDTGHLGFTILIISLVLSLIIFISWLVRRYWQSDKFKTIMPGKFIQEHKPDGGSLISFNDQKNIIAKFVPLDSHGDNIIDSLNLTEPNVYIGCESDNTGFVVEITNIKNAQAVINQSEGCFWINDLGSANGIWINYKKIDGNPIKIKSGDIVHFGYCGYRFSMIEGESSQKITFSKYEPIL